jgi:uncharacterized membrane protein YuzA (DUF378 family)
MNDKRSVWRAIDVITYVLIVIGALNWGLIGFFEYNLVATMFGEMTVLTRMIYTLVGASAIYQLLSLPGIFRRWGTASRAAAAREREREHVHV